MSGKRGEKRRIPQIPASAQSNLTQGSLLSFHTSQCLTVNPITMDELLPRPGDLQVVVLFLHVVQSPVDAPH